MTDMDVKEPLSTISDSSFVILGQGSLPSSLSNESPLKETSQNSRQINPMLQSSTSSNFLTRSSFSDAKSFLDLDTEEKLSRLLQENCNLRETLSQNNLAIKSQLDTFIMWQQEVLKTHETHKQKFIETKELIIKLRSENANLKKQLEECTQRSTLLNGSADFDSHASDKVIEVDNLKKDIRTLEERCTNLVIANENLAGEKYRIGEELGKVRNECMKLNKDVEDLSRENSFLKQKVNEQGRQDSFSYVSLPNSEARAQISNLFKQLEEERKKVSRLNEELKTAKAEKLIETSPKISTTEELNECIGKLDDMNDSLDKQTERFSSILSWVSLVEENMIALDQQKGVGNNIISEIAQLKSHLHKEENAFKEKQESLQEIHKQFNKLLEDYKELLEKVNSLENNNSKIEKYEEEIASLTEQIRIKDENLTTKQVECNNLKEAVKKLKLECEEVALLKVQMQLYQTDFNDERAAREKLVGEKEEMAEQIRLLQSRLEESNGGDNGSKASSSSTTRSPLENKKSKFVCPKCMFSFSDLERCEKHIDECLNIHFYP